MVSTKSQSIEQRVPHVAKRYAKRRAPPATVAHGVRHNVYTHLRRRENLARTLSDFFIRNRPSWLVSLVVHFLLLLILALMVIPRQPSIELFFRMSRDSGADKLEANLELDELTQLESKAALDESYAPLTVNLTPPKIDLNVLQKIGGDANATPSDGTVEDAIATPGGIAGREARRQRAVGHGATAASEAAVDRALAWLAEHQNSDGSWDFDHRGGVCHGRCGQPGSGSVAVHGATALGILPFLGAGQTHQQGRYSHVVSKGLRYLIAHQGARGSFHEPEGTMYSHGLATLALTEAIAMSQDSSGYSSSLERRAAVRGVPSLGSLQNAARQAIYFIESAQHAGGGWRYTPGEAGDTSVVGWQAMALQSGRMAGSNVKQTTFDGIGTFLDSVSSGNYGSLYGYTDPPPRLGTTAVGLLCRMYLGWEREHPGIVNGVEFLAETGPSSNNAYYNYYATQVMHHYGGPLWEAWNSVLRDHLVNTQETKGHESGSWYFDGDFGSGVGGRLYITAMAAMTLEVYYRHMPIYDHEAVGSASGP